MNSSYETEFNKTNIFMKDIITETDNKSINTNLSNLNIGILSSNKFLFKGSLTDQNQLNVGHYEEPLLLLMCDLHSLIQE